MPRTCGGFRSWCSAGAEQRRGVVRVVLHKGLHGLVLGQAQRVVQLRRGLLTNQAHLARCPSHCEQLQSSLTEHRWFEGLLLLGSSQRRQSRKQSSWSVIKLLQVDVVQLCSFKGYPPYSPLAPYSNASLSNKTSTNHVLATSITLKASTFLLTPIQVCACASLWHERAASTCMRAMSATHQRVCH